MSDEQINGREKLLIKNSILEAKIEFAKIVDEKLETLCDRLKCEEHSKAISTNRDKIKTNWWNHRTLVIVLVVTGVLGGGSAGYGIAKMIPLLVGG